MNFNSLSIIKFDELYIFILKNIKQEHVFNAISINFSIMSNLNYLITAIQCFESIIKFFLKSLTSLMILTEINNIKTLMKTMKIIILVMTVTVF